MLAQGCEVLVDSRMEPRRRATGAGRAGISADHREELVAQLRTQYSARPFEERDLRKVGWLVLERIFFAEMDASAASAASSVIRVLTALGDSPESEDEQLEEIELRGMLMNGFQPRDDRQWELAERLFGETALDEFRRWQKLPPRENQAARSQA
mgnify:FL=1